MSSYRLALACALAACALPAVASTTKPFAPVPTKHTTLAPAADPDHFTFCVAGDNRSAGHGTPMPRAFREICREMGVIHPPFVLWTGDIIEGYGDTADEADAEYDTYVAGAETTGVPVFNAPGNHEWSLNKDLEPIYEKRIGPTYGSFDYGNSHFIAVDTTPVEPDGTVKEGTLDDAQWQWLESDLQANQSAKNIFVFLHHYVFGPADATDPKNDTGWIDIPTRDRFHAMMVKYGVRAVFTSHDHLYWHAVKDGVEYFIGGGAGAPADATPDQGGFLHFFLIHVDGAKVTCDILQPWLLQTGGPRESDPIAASQTVWAENSNYVNVTADHIVLHVTPPPAGQKLVATGTTAYKKGAKAADVTIVSTTPSDDGKSVDVVVSCTLPRARTTQITVAPAAQ